jgi:hypothetical protein
MFYNNTVRLTKQNKISTIKLFVSISFYIEKFIVLSFTYIYIYIYIYIEVSPNK